MSDSYGERDGYIDYIEEKHRRHEQVVERAEALRALQAERVRHRHELDRIHREEQMMRWTQKLERAQEHSLIKVFPDLAAAASYESQRRARDGDSTSLAVTTGPRVLLRRGASTVTARPVQNSTPGGTRTATKDARDAASRVGRSSSGSRNGNSPQQSPRALRAETRSQYSSRSRLGITGGSQSQSIYESATDEWGSPLAMYSQLRRDYMKQNPQLNISSLTPSADRRLEVYSDNDSESGTHRLGLMHSTTSPRRVSLRRPRWCPVNPAMAREQLAAGWQALPLFSGCPYSDSQNVDRIWRAHSQAAQGNRPPWGRGTVADAKKRIERPAYLYTQESFSAPRL